MPLPCFRAWAEVKIFASSMCGRRTENQDNYLAIMPLQEANNAIFLDDQKETSRRIPWSNAHFRIAVADGMGGHQGGRESAQYAVQGLLTVPPCDTADIMRERVLWLNSKLNEVNGDNKKRERAGTTLVWADININKQTATLVNIGDSRGYLVRKGIWQQLTHDHTLDEFSWRDGRISDKDYLAKAAQKSNSVVQALGVGSFGILKDEAGNSPLKHSPELRVDLPNDLPRAKADHADAVTIKIKRGDILVLATDGLWSHIDNFYPDSIDFNEFSQNSIDALVRDTIIDGSQDNVTVIACEFR